MVSSPKEGRILLALQSIKPSGKLSIRQAAKAYNIPRSTLQHRRDGLPPRHDIRLKSTRLTSVEEETILQFILDKDTRGLSLRLADVEDMANQLLAERGEKPIGKHWTRRFIDRQPALRTRLSRPYDYQRALCEDPEKIRAWFKLVENMRAKYGIDDTDFYNFDETGFQMGVISPSLVVTRAERETKAKKVQPGNREWATVIQAVGADGWALPPFVIVQGAYHLAAWYTDTGIPRDWRIATTKNGWTDDETTLDWLKHFDQHTQSRRKGGYRMLVMDGHGSHSTLNFERFCKDKNIVPIYMPPHSSHLLQPLDVGCFSPLKRAYSRQIEDLIKANINHITKLEFLVALKAAFFASMGDENVKGGFRGAGLVPFNPQVVLDRLDVKLRTPTPTGPPELGASPWVSQTPHTTTEAASQTELIKNRIANHQGSSPTAILTAVDQIAKGTQAMMHKVALLKAENASLREANKALSKRRRAKKTRLRLGGSLSTQDAQVLVDEKGAGEQLEQETKEEGGPRQRAQRGPRHCSNCGKTGHNSRTCQEIVETSEEDSSE
jgi:hypothetical protein